MYNVLLYHVKSIITMYLHHHTFYSHTFYVLQIFQIRFHILITAAAQANHYNIVFVKLFFI